MAPFFTIHYLLTSKYWEFMTTKFRSLTSASRVHNLALRKRASAKWFVNTERTGFSQVAWHHRGFFSSRLFLIGRGVFMWACIYPCWHPMDGMCSLSKAYFSTSSTNSSTVERLAVFIPPAWGCLGLRACRRNWMPRRLELRRFCLR